jgi:hypothetical protein
MGDIKPKDFDIFHKLIIYDEISRSASEGLGTFLGVVGK